MKKAKLELIEQGDETTLYTISFEGKDVSEFGDFITRFKDNATLRHDYYNIVRAVQLILAGGALERRFRTEGRYNDGVCALPIESGKLRLYCLRMSDQILVVGNGGLKNVRRYEESEELSGYVMDLQKFDSIIREAKSSGLISYEKAGLDNITDKYFEL